MFNFCTCLEQTGIINYVSLFNANKHCNSARKLNKVLASKGTTVHSLWNMQRAVAGENSSANDCFWENERNISEKGIQGSFTDPRPSCASCPSPPGLYLGLQTVKKGGEGDNLEVLGPMLREVTRRGVSRAERWLVQR